MQHVGQRRVQSAIGEWTVLTHLLGSVVWLNCRISLVPVWTIEKFGTEDLHLLLYCRLCFILLGGLVVDAYIFIIVMSSAEFFINV